MIGTDIQEIRKVCKHCLICFKPDPRAKSGWSDKYCSNECYVRAERIKQCEVCGKPFKTDPTHIRCCSIDCAKKVRERNPCRCKHCGNEFVPKRKSATTFCSRECAFAYLKENNVDFRGRKADEKARSCKVYFKTCDVCGILFTDRRRTKNNLCSIECRAEYLRHRSIEKQGYERTCSTCGSIYIKKYGQRGPREYCSEQCQAIAKADVKRNAKHKRKAMLRDAFIEDVNFFSLFARDAGRCKICGKKLKISNKVPHPNAPTVDHIIPLSKGGTHEYKNVQIACFMCNSVKNNNQQSGGDQLLLFGA